MDCGDGGDMSSLVYNICVVANVVRSLGALLLPVTGERIHGGIQLATTLKMEQQPSRILDTDFLDKLVDQEAIRRMEDE
jgi:hypothetical protein